jgi:hypothetical protein
MSVGQMDIEAGSVKKIGIRVQGPDCKLTSIHTCMLYANTHFFLNFGVRQLPYMVKYEYVDCFDVLFKRFQEVLQTDITQINTYPANVENRASS